MGTTDVRSSIIEPNLIGREHEIASFSDELQNGTKGMAGFVSMEAVSGCGKSKLLEEYALLAKQTGCWVINGIGQSDVAPRSFQLLDDLISQVGDRCRREPEFQIHLQDKLGAEAAILSEVLPDLAVILGWTRNQQIGPEVFGQTRGIQAICKLFSLLGSAERPCVIIFDDCQWIDNSSVKLIDQWNKISKRKPVGERFVLTVVSFRREEVSGNHPLRLLNRTTHLHLDLFDDAEIRAIAGSMAGNLPERVLDLVYKMSAGSPFMATAIVRGMFETGTLESTDHGWRINETAINDLQSSNDAAQLLARRIDLLPASTRQFLSHGAILGKVFQIEIVRMLLKRKNVDLNEAVSRNLVWIDEDNDACHFVHDKIREELLLRQDADQRKRLHLETARLLETLPVVPLIELAYHFDAANDHQSALPYALESAEIARRQFSVDLAAKQYLMARRANSQNREIQFQIARGLGEVQMLGGNYSEAAETLAEAAKLADSSFDRAQVIGKQGELAFKRGDMETATVKIEESIRGLGALVPRSALALTVMFVYELAVQVIHTAFPRMFIERKKRVPNAKERLRLHLGSRYAQACWFARSKARCMWTHFRTLNLAEQYLPCGEVAQAFSDHAPAMSLVPWPKRGIRYANRSLQMRRELQDTWGQGQSLHYYGIVLYAAARFEECIEKCREAVCLLEQTGDQWEQNMARYQIAASLYQLGRLDEAQQEARLLYESGLELGDQQASAISLDVLARVRIGHPSLDVFEQELGRERFDSQGTAQLLLGKGVCQIGNRQLEDAADSFRLGLKIGRTSGIRSVYVLPLYAWLSTTLRRMAERTAAYQSHRKNRLIRASQRYARQMLIFSWPHETLGSPRVARTGSDGGHAGKPPTCDRLHQESDSNIQQPWHEIRRATLPHRHANGQLRADQR